MRIDKDTSDGKTSRRRTGIAMVLAMMVIVVVSISIVVCLEDQDDQEIEGETYSGDYRDYYEHWVLGIPTGDVEDYLNEDIDLTLTGISGPLVIYQHRTPRLETMEDAELYLAGFGFDVTGYSHKTFEDPPGHNFYKGGCSIGLVVDGRFSVFYQVHHTHDWEPNITREEGIDIGLGYIKNHTGIPDGAIITNDTCSRGSSAYEGVKVESFTVGIKQSIDGYLIGAYGGRDSIWVEVDAQTGRVERFEYRWVTLEPIDEIGQEDLGRLDEIVTSFVTGYNADAATWHDPPDSTVNITDVRVFYKNPLGASGYDIYDDCLFYVYLPYVAIEWADGKGSTIVSPLDPED
jgi:hypothetical protein